MAAPQAASSETKYIRIQVIGGELPGAKLAQRVGPLGIPAKVVGEDIKSATADYKGLKIVVQLTIKDRKATVEVKPSTSTLIIKALKEPVRDRKKEKNILHNGSLKMTEVVEIARIIRPRSFSKTFAGTVKEVLGSCKAVGCRVDGKCPKEVTMQINNGEIKLPDQ
jgi:large subunit ribosomal protein L12e